MDNLQGVAVVKRLKIECRDVPDFTKDFGFELSIESICGATRFPASVFSGVPTGFETRWYCSALFGSVDALINCGIYPSL